MLDELRIEKGKSGELVLVKVHHEQLVGGCELGALAGKLTVKVGDILAMALGRRIVNFTVMYQRLRIFRQAGQGDKITSLHNNNE
jgi:hypothetical protein